VKRSVKRLPDGVLAIAAVDERVTGGVVVDQDSSAHAEVQSERRAGAVGVEQEQLAAASGRSEPVAGERGLEGGGGETALEIPRVGRVDPGDVAAQRALLDEPARVFDLDAFGQARQAVVIAPCSAPWASLAYLARTPLV